jgi:Bacterial Ig domain/FG-GAP repeat
MAWHGVRWLMLAGLGPLSLGCTDDLPSDPEGSSSGPSDPTGEPPVSTTSSGPSDPSTSTGPLDTTMSPDATAEGSTSESGDTSTTDAGTTATSSSSGDSSSTGPEPVVHPTANDDGACMLRPQPSLLLPDVLANDVDPQGSPLALVTVDAVSTAGGTVVADGTALTYTPPVGFWGEDQFTYTIADPEGHEAIAEVHVMVWPGPIAASELVAGNHGLSISPDVGLGRLGWSLAGGGDLDGDGFDDVVISAPFAWNGMGRIYVVFGGPAPTPVQLTAMAGGSGGYVLYGDLVNEYAGWSVDVLDDLDGDGRDDLAIGAGWSNANGNRAGRVHVVFSQAFGGTLALSEVMGIDGYTIDGAFAEDWAGWSVGGIDDLDGDGIGEVLVGAPQATDVLPGAPGHAYVVFGKADTSPVWLSDVLLGLGGGFAMVGQAGDHAGMATADLPDLDGDGLPEIMVGSEIAAGGAGRAYIVYGQATPNAVSLVQVMGEVGGYGLEGAATDVALGRSADGIGDLDGDGLPEIMVAAPGPALAGNAAVHVLSGASTSSLVLGTPTPAQGTTIPGQLIGDNLGWSVATLPDWNGDGIPDLALGAPSAGGDFGPGAVYVVFGRADMTTVDLEAVAQGIGGFMVTGEDWDDDAGWRVASAGDFDGDGSTDLLLGAPQTETLGGLSGRAYVVLGVAPSMPGLGACVPD